MNGRVFSELYRQNPDRVAGADVPRRNEGPRSIWATHGQIMGRPHRRARYLVTRHTRQELAFRAFDIVTAINVGLNEVTLRTFGDRNVEYSVTYRRWGRAISWSASNSR